MKLILKNLKQVEFNIFITSAKITIKEFKKEIEKLYSFDSEQIKLIFDGTVLENDKTLEEYKIRENNHIIIMNTKTKLIKNENKPKPIEYQEKSQQIKPEIEPKDKPNISQVLNDNWTIQVNSLVDMGFERSQVEAAVKGANGRIDLAIEYLNNGIPNNNNIQSQRNKDDITKELKKQAGVIKMLCKDNKLRIFEILNNIKCNDPGLMRLITDYRDDFKNYLDSPITEEDKQNYEKIEAEADKIQKERKEQYEREKKEKEKEKEKNEDKNEEKKEDDKDSSDKNKEQISKEEKNEKEKEKENKMEEEEKDKKENEEIKEDKEANIFGENMEDKQEEKNDSKSNNIEVKNDDNMGIEEKDKSIEKNNNEFKQENSEKKYENEIKMEAIEEKKEEKKESDEDNKKEEKVIENKESKDKGQEKANINIENSGNNSLINQLTEEEKEAVNRIKSICEFSFQTVAEAYIVCNKNEEVTVNFLFENM